MNNNGKITVDRVRALAAEGMDVYAIAHAMGISDGSVRRCARANDIKIKGYETRNFMTFPNHVARVQFINKMAAEGKTLDEIATAMGVKTVNLRESLSRDRNLSSRPKTEKELGTAQQMDEVRGMLAANMNFTDIATRTGLNRGTVSRWAKQLGNDAKRSSPLSRHTINNRKAVENTVLSIEATAASITNIHVSMEGITAEQARDWLDSLNDSLRVLNRLRATLKEHAHVQD